jgi:hypothetical protein
MIDFDRFSYFCTGAKTSEKNGKKVEKKVFMTVYLGLKSEFSLILNTFYFKMASGTNYTVGNANLSDFYSAPYLF